MNEEWSRIAANAICCAAQRAGDSAMYAADAHGTPSAVMRPKVFKDGNAWCALYGDDLQIGVAGFGDSPAAACAAFDKAWYGK